MQINKLVHIMKKRFDMITCADILNKIDFSRMAALICILIGWRRGGGGGEVVDELDLKATVNADLTIIILKTMRG